MKSNRRRILKAGFAVYSVLMLWLLFGQRVGRTTWESYIEQIHANLYLVPFRTTGVYLGMLRSGVPERAWHALIDLTGNVILFIPLGCFLPDIWPSLRHGSRFFLCVTAVIAVVEVSQLFTLLGACDIDDLIWNIAGAMTGYVFFWQNSWKSGNILKKIFITC